MDGMNHQQAEREAQRVQANREELVERMTRVFREDGSVQPLKGLHLNRLSTPHGPVYGVTQPSFCVIAQGSKDVLLGANRYRYDPMHYLLATVGLPSVSHVREASKDRPYLSLRLELPPSSSARLRWRAVTLLFLGRLIRGPSMSARWMGTYWTPSCGLCGSRIAQTKRRPSCH